MVINSPSSDRKRETDAVCRIDNLTLGRGRIFSATCLGGSKTRELPLLDLFSKPCFRICYLVEQAISIFADQLRYKETHIQATPESFHGRNHFGNIWDLAARAQHHGTVLVT